MSIRVVLADDQSLLRATFRLLLDSAADIDVVGEAATGRQAVDQARIHSPDVIVMDIRMPDMDGIDATRQICTDPALGGTRILILTTFETDDLVLAALRAGASGFLGKGVEPAGLLTAIRTVAAGEQLLSPSATRALIERALAALAAPAVETTALASLTERELEVTRLVARGLSNGEIAADLFISPATAKTHVNRAMMKAGARDRAQLVVMAYQSGVATPLA